MFGVSSTPIRLESLTYARFVCPWQTPQARKEYESGLQRANPIRHSCFVIL